MSDDDFFIPTGDELDRGEIPEKPRKRGLRGWFRERRESRGGKPETRRVELDVPESIGKRKTIRMPDREPNGDRLVDKAGSTGRVVRSIDASTNAAKRDLIIPPELRAKYGLDE